MHTPTIKKLTLIVCSALSLLSITATSAYGAPQGGNVASGSANISQQGSVTNINQASHSAVINWDNFDIAKTETVNFIQPSNSSSTLNRVNSGQASIINGKINANGRVFIINGSGMIFGNDSVVNAASFMATTHDISNDDFMDENYTFNRTTSGGAIINQGLIQAASGGTVSLVGDAVSNEGIIIAKLGNVHLASGETATLDFDGDNLITFAVDGKLLENNTGLSSAISNSGSIDAEGGTIILNSQSASDLLDSVVNIEGALTADTVYIEGNTIIISAGNTFENTFNATEEVNINSYGNTYILTEAGHINHTGNVIPITIYQPTLSTDSIALPASIDISNIELNILENSPALPIFVEPDLTIHNIISPNTTSLSANSFNTISTAGLNITTNSPINTTDNLINISTRPINISTPINVTTGSTSTTSSPLNISVGNSSISTGSPNLTLN